MVRAGGMEQRNKLLQVLQVSMDWGKRDGEAGQSWKKGVMGGCGGRWTAFARLMVRADGTEWGLCSYEINF